MPVIPATQETEAGESVSSRPVQAIFARSYLKNEIKTKGLRSQLKW
jgi:hypothetical protein